MDNVKTDSKYDISLRDIISAKSSNDLTGYFNIQSMTNSKKKVIDKSNKETQMKFQNESIEKMSKKNEIPKLDLTSRIVYLPKRKVKFTPMNMMSYPNPGSSRFTIDGDKKENKVMPMQFHYNKNEKLTKEKESKDHAPNFYAFNKTESEYLTFKTNYVLKFARNVEAYEKMSKYLDLISDENKKYILDYFRKLKLITDKKDRILFDAMNCNLMTNSSTSSENYQHWKDITILFHELEVFWLKFSEIALKELKATKDENTHLSKKVSDQSNSLKMKENEIEQLNGLIEAHDLNSKNQKVKKQKSELEKIKEEYEKKEKVNVLQVFRLEEE